MGIIEVAKLADRRTRSRGILRCPCFAIILT